MYIPIYSLNTSKYMKFTLFLGVLSTLTGIQNDLFSSSSIIACRTEQNGFCNVVGLMNTFTSSFRQEPTGNHSYALWPTGDVKNKWNKSAVAGNWPWANFTDRTIHKAERGRGRIRRRGNVRKPIPNKVLWQLAFPVRAHYVVRNNICKVYGLQSSHKKFLGDRSASQKAKERLS